MESIIIGIDSGANGGVCVMYPDGGAKASPLGTIAEFFELLSEVKASANSRDIQAFVEEVTGYIGGHPQPASRSFVLGKSYGMILGLLVGMQIPFHTVRPQKWQMGLSGVRGVDYTTRKRRLKEIALQRFPKLKPTLKTADAILIAEFGKGVAYGA